MEGIETRYNCQPRHGAHYVSRCPDMEGIETLRKRHLNLAEPNVSRCPDMEGIETPCKLSNPTSILCQ